MIQVTYKVEIHHAGSVLGVVFTEAPNAPTIKGTGYVVVSVEFDGVVVGFGSSMCSKSDTFNYQRGRCLAFSRAMSQSDIGRNAMRGLFHTLQAFFDRYPNGVPLVYDGQTMRITKK